MANTGHKWTKAQHARASRATKDRLARKRFSKAAQTISEAQPLDTHYAGETLKAPTIDVAKLEERAFRRGMFTALQMVMDYLIRELQ
jgi:hypothetical protein